MGSFTSLNLSFQHPLGAISDYQSRVETITNLDQIGRKIGLDKCIVPHQASKDQAVARKTMVEALKAVLWAVYVSSGKTTAGARAVMNKIGLWPDQ
jgi:dsRNA-specific ribonuclease